jgi:major membrane immunogen (membrane-anchored lipoprotein)
MKKKSLRALALSLSLSLLATACGDSNAKEDDGSNFKCHAMGWCTNMVGDDTEVTGAPALTGGTIKDGIYRLEQGLGVDDAEAMFIQGNNILFLGHLWSNYQGTWKVANGKMEVEEFASCDASDDGPMKDKNNYTIEYAVRGDELFTVNSLDEPKILYRWLRVTDLCKTSNSFKCWGGRCACDSTVNMPLTGNENCTLPY